MTLISLLLALLAQPAAPACETIGPRLDHTYVTICNGTVTSTTNTTPKTAYTYLRPESR
jgi:hypothetical protein